MKESLVEDWAKQFTGKSAGENGKYEIQKLNYYLEFTKQDAEQILREAKELTREIGNRKVQLQIINFYRWLQEVKGKSVYASYSYTKAIRSFYSFYGIPLKFRRNDIKKPQKKKIDYRLNLDEVRGIITAANNLRSKALIVTLESTGLRPGDIAQFLRRDLEILFAKKEEPPLMIEVDTQKCHIVGFPFLHSTAIRILKEYLESRDDNSQWLFPTLIEVSTKSKEDRHVEVREVNRIFRDSFFRAGYKAGNYRVRAYCLRKFCIGRLQDAQVEENLWRRIVGKNCPEIAYSSDKLREAYCSALNLLDPESLKNSHAKMEDLEETVKSLIRDNEALQNKISTLENRKSMEDFLKEFSKDMKESLTEAFKNSKAVSMPKNGMPVTVKLNSTSKMDGSDVLVLKSLSKTMQRLYDKEKRKEGD